MYEEILVPTDGSQGSAHVALQAIDLAEQYGAAVHVLSVVDDSHRSLIPNVGGADDSLEEEAQRAIDRVTKMASWPAHTAARASSADSSAALPSDWYVTPPAR